MAVSKARADWAMLLLRLAVGGYALYHGLGPVLHGRGSLTFTYAIRLGLALTEMICGALVVVGVWMTPATIALAAILLWPLAQGWFHGARFLSSIPALFRLLATAASGVGGPGKWSVSN